MRRLAKMARPPMAERERAQRQRSARTGASVTREYSSPAPARLGAIQPFRPKTRQMTVAEMATRVELDRAMARRLLLTRVKLAIAATNAGQFVPTPRGWRPDRAQRDRNSPGSPSRFATFVKAWTIVLSDAREGPLDPQPNAGITATREPRARRGSLVPERLARRV
jgi:hypothetical protein